jgi:hypothetical protein
MPAPKPPIPGLEVSPVYEKLGIYISQHFTTSTDVYRLALLSLAYTTYCRDKKDQIATNMRLTGNDWKHPTVIRAYTQFESESYYEKYCTYADTALRRISEDSLFDRITKKFHKNPVTYVLSESVWHFAGLALGAILTLVVITIIALVKSTSMRETAHDFGGKLIDVGQYIQNLF